MKPPWGRLSQVATLASMDTEPGPLGSMHRQLNLLLLNFVFARLKALRSIVVIYLGIPCESVSLFNPPDASENIILISDLNFFSWAKLGEIIGAFR